MKKREEKNGKIEKNLEKNGTQISSRWTETNNSNGGQSTFTTQAYVARLTSSHAVEIHECRANERKKKGEEKKSRKTRNQIAFNVSNSRRGNGELRESP